jgi:hypothetical protein
MEVQPATKHPVYQIDISGKKKITFTPEQGMKAQRRCRAIALLFL